MPRKSFEERKADLEKRKQHITNRLLKLDAQNKLQERKRDARQKIVVGAAVIAHAKIDGTFANLLADVLNRAVSRPIDRDVIAPFLNPAASSSETAKASETKKQTIPKSAP